MKSFQKILIVGGTGYVGSTIARALAKDHEVTCTFRNPYTPIKGVKYVFVSYLEVKDNGKNLINRVEPDAVIYCAGNNDPVYCELDANIQPSQVSHCSAAANLIPAIDTLKAKLIYISSDFIFSGTDGNFAESDTVIPTYQLGKSKSSAENFVGGRCMNHVIIRCAPLIGRGTIDHPSWIDKIREPLLRGKKIQVPSKVVHNPVHISALVDLIHKILENDLKNQTLHLGGLSKVSDLEFAQIFASQFSLDPALIEASDSGSQLGSSDYSLNFSESMKVIKFKPLPLEESLELLK